MGHDKGGPETSHEQRTHHKMQVIYSRKMHERQIFMDELKIIRKRREKRYIKAMIKSIGPNWYQALSVPQREALDTLETCIYQDLLENRAVRTYVIIKMLGIYPRPHPADLLKSCFEGRDDPKVMLSHLFLTTYGHPISAKRLSYDLNGRLMLSSIFYLGLNDLIKSLREIFRPDKKEVKPPPKRKPKIEEPPVSPYLQKMIAALYEPKVKKRAPPPPLPNLDKLNEEPLQVEEVIQKPPPPPPPPPPPKDRLPRTYCDKIAGVYTIEPHSSVIERKTVTTTRKRRSLKQTDTEVKKQYGIGLGQKKAGGGRMRKPPLPSTGLWNAQYMICGVYTVHGKRVFVLGNVSILPASGELIHGGYSYRDGKFINIHCGYKGLPPPPKPDPCNCVKKWQDVVFQYVRRTKCYCGHHFDYGNEGTFLPEELPFFHKATRHSPYMFNYNNIFNTDPKSLHIDKEFKRIWETDSMLRVDDGTIVKDKKKKKRSITSATCLGDKPKPEDYLKCALNLLKAQNVAARLPDVYLAPELKEWMRYRMYGPYKKSQKVELLRKSADYWQLLNTLEAKGFGHVSPPFNASFSITTDWSKKQSLNDNFRKYIINYRLKLQRSYARVTNLMWPTMCQAQFPDKKFREIFFSYLYPRMEDLQIMHPYSVMETAYRSNILRKGRMVCIPAGAEYIEK